MTYTMFESHSTDDLGMVGHTEGDEMIFVTMDEYEAAPEGLRSDAAYWEEQAADNKNVWYIVE